MNDDIIMEAGGRHLSDDIAKDINALKQHTQKHINDVNMAMNFIAENVRQRGPRHDHTKMERMKDYQKAMLAHFKGSEGTKWYHIHDMGERHHLKRYVPPDINLIDIMEYVCDSTMAGTVRTNGGKIYDLSLPADVVNRAINNTAKLLQRYLVKVESVEEAEDMENQLIDESADIEPMIVIVDEPYISEYEEF